MDKIRGLVFHSRFNYVKQHLDYTMRRAISDALSENTRHVISDQVFPVNFYSFSLLQELDETILKVTREDETELFSKMGNHFARLIVDRYFYIYTEFQQPQRMLMQYQRLYDRLWGFGEIEVVPSENNSVTVIFNYTIPIHKAYDVFMASFIQNAVKFCQVKDLHFIEENSEDKDKIFRKYQIKWTE
jgi:uncharacterized protein (TIGR02265 family)